MLASLTSLRASSTRGKLEDLPCCTLFLQAEALADSEIASSSLSAHIAKIPTLTFGTLENTEGLKFFL